MTMIDDCMLTTYDNPWDPFTQFDEWFAFDEIVAAHHTCGYIARLVEVIKDKFNYNDDIATDMAMEWIVLEEPEIYRKIDKEIKSTAPS